MMQQVLMAKYTWIEIPRLRKTSLRRLVKTQDGYSLQPQQQQSQIHLKETIMFLNAMAKVLDKRELTIKQPSGKQKGEVEELPPGKQRKSEPKRCDPFEGLSTRKLYMRRPMD